MNPELRDLELHWEHLNAMEPNKKFLNIAVTRGNGTKQDVLLTPLQVKEVGRFIGAELEEEIKRLRELETAYKRARDLFWPSEGEIESLIYEIRNGETKEYVLRCAKELGEAVTPKP